MSQSDLVNRLRRKSIARKNIVLLVVLIAIIALLYSITLMRLGELPAAAIANKVSGV